METAETVSVDVDQAVELVQAASWSRAQRDGVPFRLIGTLGPVELERLLAVASRRDRLIIALSSRPTRTSPEAGAWLGHLRSFERLNLICAVRILGR